MRWTALVIMGLLLVVTTYVSAENSRWTPKKLDKAIVRMHKAADRKQWNRAIIYGEKMLDGFKSIEGTKSTRYIHQLKNIITYYDKSQRLLEAGDKVQVAYNLAKQELGLNHNTTNISRNLLYKQLLAQKRYVETIPLVLENLSLPTDKDPEQRKLYYLKQLFSLYGLTNQLAKQQSAIEEYIALDTKLFKNMADDRRGILKLLAQNYCRQQKQVAFQKLTKLHDIKLFCPKP